MHFPKMRNQPKCREKGRRRCKERLSGWAFCGAVAHINRLEIVLTVRSPLTLPSPPSWGRGQGEGAYGRQDKYGTLNIPCTVLT